MQSRILALDVETTGLYPDKGDRIVEIGLVELIDRRPTGKQFHAYLDPERSVPEEVVKIHGLDDAFLAGKPKFAEVVDEFIDFISGGELVIHNAPFDMGFLNMELARAGSESLDYLVVGVVDTLVMSRVEGTAKRHSLDALCDRYGVNNERRTLHGALLDAQLLSEVYVCMTRGQGTLIEGVSNSAGDQRATSGVSIGNSAVGTVVLSVEEENDHNAYLSSMLKDTGGRQVLWVS